MKRLTATMTPGIILSKSPLSAALVGILALLALTSLAGCGKTETTGAPSGQTEANLSAPSQAQVIAAQTTPVPDNSMSGMSMLDTCSTCLAFTPTPEATTQQASGNSSLQTGTGIEEGSETQTVVQAALIEWSIQLSRSEVPAGKVQFVVSNNGTMMHNLTVEDDSGVIAKTANFRPTDGSQTLEVDLKPGIYTLICSIPGHAKRGQVATLVVK
jgi:hypothetical protein